MDAIKPLVADSQTSRLMLGGIGVTKLYSLTNRGEIERRYIDNKAVWTVASLEAYVSRLASEAPTSLTARNGNLKYVEAA